MPTDPLTPGRGLLLIGPQGAGKTKLAMCIAAGRGGRYYMIDCDELNRTSLPNHLMQNRTLIIDGAPRTPRARAHIKRLVASKNVPFRTRSGEMVSLEPPAVIVCTTEDAPADFDTGRMFDVLHLQTATSP